MLYVTTRNNRDAYTAQRVLRENRGPDGGLYLPFRAPGFSQADLDALAEKSFNSCVAEVLNLLFNTKLTQWDVDFCVGRYPVRLVNLPQRILMAECWHNPKENFGYMAGQLAARLRADGEGIPSDWAEIGVRIAVLFGIFGELKRAGMAYSEKKVDISVVSGDFAGPISAGYARSWGLPIGNIVCCCNENGNLWDLIHHGQLRTDAVSVKTATTDADVTLPAGLERLVFASGGTLEVNRYLEVCRRGGMYCPNDGVMAKLRKGLHVSVVSTRRMESTIPSVYSTSAYLLSPYGALCHAGLLDYRAKTGESRLALVISEKSPVQDAAVVAKALGVSEKELEAYL